MKIENCKARGYNCTGCGKENKKGIKITYHNGNGTMLNICEDCMEVFSSFFSPHKKEFDFTKCKDCKWWFTTKGEGCELKGSDECERQRSN